jgi:transcription initiation factor TFIIE subunit alpha
MYIGNITPRTNASLKSFPIGNIYGVLVVDVEDPIYRAYLCKLVGEEGLHIVECMPEDEVTDEYVAELTEITLNSVRRTLYLLYEHRLARYRRVRDPESGWLTYLWQLTPDNLDRALEVEIRKLLRNLEGRLSYEKSSIFYACINGCARFVFDEASESGFVCPFCQSDLEFMDNSTVVEAMEKRMEGLKAAL